MASPSWNISGQYFETCNCDFVCPCVPSQMQQSTKGFCDFAMAFHVERGSYGDVSLNDRTFVVVGHTPEEMANGNWSVGILVDDQATPEQQQALGAIVSGQAGGPMSGLAPLIGNFLGMEARPIQFQGDGKTWSVAVTDRIDQAIEAAHGIGDSPEPLYLDNTGHPANNRFALAHATRSHVHAFGIGFDDVSGRNNGQFAPFSWQG